MKNNNEDTKTFKKEYFSSLVLYFHDKNIQKMNLIKIEKSVIKTVEKALLSASFYIKDNMDTISDEEYWKESENVLLLINDSLKQIRELDQV